MGKDYAIYTKVEPGPLLVEIATNLIKDLPTIDTLRFVKYDKRTNGAIGIFYGHKKEVLIDLGNILQNTDLFKYGALFIPAVFYTALWALFHEVFHGHQIQENPALLKMNRVPNDCEEAAQRAAQAGIQMWTNINKLPPIEEWGWLGEKIIEFVNSRYTKGDLTWTDEVDLMKQGAFANAEAVLAAWDFDDPSTMYKAILTGDLGIKIDTNYYLTAIDFFGLDTPKPETVRSAQAVLME